jgi:hypothetical protein
MFGFVRIGEVSFFCGSLCTLHDLNDSMTSLRLNTSIGGLRALRTNGSPPTKVPEAPVKWTRPARSRTDLQVGLNTLSTNLATLEDSRRPYPDPGGSVGLGAQDELPDRGLAPPVGLQIAGYSL